MANQQAPLLPERSKQQSSSTQGTSKPPKSSNVKVVVRVRPVNAVECLGNHKNVVRAMDERVVVFDPHDDIDANSFIPSKRTRRRSNIMDRRVKDLRFIFDRVFDEKSTNQDVFDHTTKTIIDGVLNGYNCTVFAYGATGAGKTHTMLGNGETPGVMFLTMMELYSRIDEIKEEKTCEVAVSYLEVYNETIRDLLMPGKPLAVREDPQRGVCVSGLTLHQPRSAEELFGMLEYGNRNRSQHPTDANATSSRSHAVFQVFVRQKSKASGLKADIQVAKMSLIDLAGSERATVTTNRGARFREGANINKSLLALGNCINALAENQGKNLHIPYRDSKLTRILKDSLGANCRTVMIAAVSPSGLSYEDTYNTLKYANRAKSIKSNLVKNIVSVDVHVSRYAKLVQELQQEVARLKEKLNKFECGEATPLNRNHTRTQSKEEMEKLKSEIKTVYGERSEIKKNIIDTECLEKELMEKLLRKQKNVEWMNLLCQDETKTNKVETRVRKCLSATRSRVRNLKERKEKLNEQLQKNDEWLQRTQDEIKTFENNDDGSCMSQSLFTDYESLCTNVLTNKELKQECKYYRKCIQNYENQRKRERRLIDALIKFVRKQFTILKSSGMVTDEITNDYDNIVNIVEDNREVAWADQNSQAVKDTGPVELIKMVDSNLSLTVNNNIVTPAKTPQKPKLLTSLTPRRMKTPTLELTSTLPLKNDLVSPFVPGTNNSRTKTTIFGNPSSQLSVRQNLLNVLNETGSISSTSFDFSSTKPDINIQFGPSSHQLGASGSLESGKTQEFPKPILLKSTNTLFQADPAVVSTKTTCPGKRFYPRYSANSNKSVSLPLRAHNDNSSNIQTSSNNQSMMDTNVLRQKTNTTSGSENIKKLPSYATLTKSAAQKIISKDMLPKRNCSKENNYSHPKRRKLPRSLSSSALSEDQSKKREQHKYHISGLKRAVSVLHMRK